MQTQQSIEVAINEIQSVLGQLDELRETLPCERHAPLEYEETRALLNNARRSLDEARRKAQFVQPYFPNEKIAAE